MHKWRMSMSGTMQRGIQTNEWTCENCDCKMMNRKIPPANAEIWLDDNGHGYNQSCSSGGIDSQTMKIRTCMEIVALRVHSA